MPIGNSQLMDRAHADARLKQRAEQRLSSAGKRALRRPRRERFVRAYLVSFDGASAALEAGYAPGVAPRIAPVLLRAPEVQARLRHLSLQGVGPAPNPRDVLETALRRVFVDLSGLYRVDPATGGVRLDLRGATPEQLNALNVRQVTRAVKGREEVTTTVSTPDRSREFAVVARALAARGPERDEERDEYDRMMAAAYKDVMRSGGSSFTPHWTSGYPDEVVDMFHPMKESWGPGESPFRIPPAYHLLFPDGPGGAAAIAVRADGGAGASGRAAGGAREVSGVADPEGGEDELFRGSEGRGAGADGPELRPDGTSSSGRCRSAKLPGLKYGAVRRKNGWSGGL